MANYHMKISLTYPMQLEDRKDLELMKRI